MARPFGNVESLAADAVLKTTYDTWTVLRTYPFWHGQHDSRSPGNWPGACLLGGGRVVVFEQHRGQSVLHVPGQKKCRPPELAEARRQTEAADSRSPAIRR